MNRRKAVFKMIGGVKHKLCSGPAHPEGKFVPVSNFFANKADNSRSEIRPQCKDCETIYHGAERRIPYSEIKFAVTELIFRLGAAETGRRVGVRPNTVWEWTSGRTKFVRRSSARAVILALAQARAKDEARHRKSIRHGAAARGRTERVPKHTHDFNGKNDAGNHAKKNYNARHPEQQREIWRQSDKQKKAKKRQKQSQLTSSSS